MTAHKTCTRHVCAPLRAPSSDDAGRGRDKRQTRQRWIADAPLGLGRLWARGQSRRPSPFMSVKPMESPTL